MMPVGAADVAQIAQLAEPERSRVRRLLDAAGGAIWIVSGRRTMSQQIALRREHCGPTSYDIWQKPAAQCSPPTARPGTSQHERGEAVDFGGNLGLAERLAPRFGLESPVEGEAWHFEPVGGGKLFPGLAGLGLGGGGLPGPIDDILGGAIGDVFGGPAGWIEDQIAGALGKLVQPLLSGLGRIALTGTLIAGGVGLVVLGGIRSTKGTR